MKFPVVHGKVLYGAHGDVPLTGLELAVPWKAFSWDGWDRVGQVGQTWQTLFRFHFSCVLCILWFPISAFSAVPDS